MIASQPLFEHISLFRVNPLTIFSDHNMLSVIIRTAPFIHNNKTKNKNPNTKPLPKRFRWNENSAQKFLESLSQPHIIDKLNAMPVKETKNAKADIQIQFNL